MFNYLKLFFQPILKLIIGDIKKAVPGLNARMFIQARVSLEKAEPETRATLEKMVGSIGARFVYTPELKEKTDDGGRKAVISKPEDLSSDKIVREVILRRFASANDRTEENVMDDEENALLEAILTQARGGNEET